MRIAGEQHGDTVLRPRDERASQRGDLAVDLIDRLERPEPQIGRHLVVARAAGVELAGDRPHFGVQQALDQSMHVLVGRAHGRAIGQPLGDAVETVEQLRLLGSGHDADAAESMHPGLAGGHVLGPQPVIDG